MLGVTQLNFFAVAETSPQAPSPKGRGDDSPSPSERGPGGEVSFARGAAKKTESVIFMLDMTSGKC